VLNGYHGHRPYALHNNQRYSANYRNQRQRTIGHRYDDPRYAKVIIELDNANMQKIIGIQMTTRYADSQYRSSE
jgi:protoheme ferro-lyase